ncbi:MAG: TIGR02147 family protein [Bdellovibrio sp.]|nr:TIGR02147 family protein [Bdellovibrio sp.]
MGISSGRLSEILNEKRPLTEHYLDKVCLALKLTQSDISKLRRALQGNSTESVKEKNYGQLLSEKQVALLTDWKPFALMSFFQTGTYGTIWSKESLPAEQIKIISQHMALSVSEIKSVIEVMTVAHLIRWEANHWEPQFESASTGYDIPSEAIQEGLTNDLVLATQKLKSLDVYHRDFSSMTLVMNGSDMLKAKKMIRTFRRNFAKTFEKQGKDGVYQLSIQFFPITIEEKV